MEKSNKAECKHCKQSLEIRTIDGREVAFDLVENQIHVCWALPEDANLLVMDDGSW